MNFSFEGYGGSLCPVDRIETNPAYLFSGLCTTGAFDEWENIRGRRAQAPRVALGEPGPQRGRITRKRPIAKTGDEDQLALIEAEAARWFPEMQDDGQHQPTGTTRENEPLALAARALGMTQLDYVARRSVHRANQGAADSASLDAAGLV